VGAGRAIGTGDRKVYAAFHNTSVAYMCFRGNVGLLFG